VDEIFKLIVKSYGIIGLVLLSPFVAVFFLWKHTQRLQDKHEQALEKVNETHLKRVDDAKQVTDKLLVMVEEHAELSKETNVALDRVGDALVIIQAQGGLNLPNRPRPRRKDEEGGT
jgi:uncharacterized protein YpmB